jgi:hypothetical protein
MASSTLEKDRMREAPFVGGTGLWDTTLNPQRRIGRPPLAYLHGAANNPTELLGAVLPSIEPMMVQIADRDGFEVGCPWRTQLWNNQLDRDRITATLTYLRTTWGAAADPGALVGASMGGASGVGYPQAFPAAVTCSVIIMPALDLDWLWTNDYLGARAPISTAHGVVWSPGAVLPAGVNPILSPPAVPTQLWLPNNDGFGTNVADWASDHADLVEFHDLGAVGHTDAAVAAVDDDLVRAFIARHTTPAAA